MNQMQIMFIALALIMLLVAGFFVVRPLLQNRRNQDTAASTEQATVALAVLREQLAELDADTAQGTRDQAALDADRAELERRALDEGIASPGTPDLKPSRKWAAIVAVFVASTAIAGYLVWGEPAGLIASNTQRPAASSDADAIKSMVDGMAVRLQQESGSAKDWVMLARSYIVLEDYGKAVAAFSQVGDVEINDADVWADWAEAVALQNTKVNAESERLAFKALDVDDQHIKALLLVGTAAYERQEYVVAVAHWQKVLDQHSEDDMGVLRDTVASARSKAGL